MVNVEGELFRFYAPFHAKLSLRAKFIVVKIDFLNLC